MELYTSTLPEDKAKLFGDDPSVKCKIEANLY
jgi:hypothetical protein